MTNPILIKRVYEPALAQDGVRILVDRLWPRGISREFACLELWHKNIAPSPDLRKWFNHQPERWQTFRVDYIEELKTKPDAVNIILNFSLLDPVTLVFGAKNPVHNHARVLLEFLEDQ